MREARLTRKTFSLLALVSQTGCSLVNLPTRDLNGGPPSVQPAIPVTCTAPQYSYSTVYDTCRVVMVASHMAGHRVHYQ